MDKTKERIKVGMKVKVSPSLSNEDDWIVGTVIDVEDNPFRGVVIAMKDDQGRIFFGEDKYFVSLN